MKPSRVWERLVAHWPAKLVSLAAATLLFFFYRYSSLEERSLSVPLKLNLPAGLAVATPYPKSVRVTLRGKAEDISGILEDDLSVSGDLRRFDTEGQYRLPLRATRVGNALKIAPLIVKVDPPELRLVLEKEEVKSVKVVPVIKGEPAHGYELAQYDIRPDTVEVSGPRTAVQALKEVNTEEVDVTGSSEDFTFEIPLARENPLMRYPRESAVMFRGIVRPMEEIRNFEQVEIIGIDLTPELVIAQPLPKGSIRLQGSLLAIEAMPGGSPKLILDCKSVRRPGTVRLATKPDVPAGLIVLKYEPQELAVSFASKGKEVSPQ